MNTNIKCPHCGKTIAKNVSYNGYFTAAYKCLRCKKVFTIELKNVA